MKLSQALKLKNRLAGELVRLQNIFTRENSRRNDNPSKVNPEEIWNKILKVTDDLSILKAKIATANIKIYPMIEQMAELKSRITFIQNVPKREGEEIVALGYASKETRSYQWQAFINQEKSDKMVEGIQLAIEKCQDNIDTYNNTTEI